MSFGFSMRRWDRFEPEELAEIQAFAQRVCPSLSWERLISAHPRPLSRSFWNDFAAHWDLLLEQYGVRGHWESLHLLPFDFGERPAAPRTVQLRPGWFVIDAAWVARHWPGRQNPAYEYRCRAYAQSFTAWMGGLTPGTIEAEIERLLARPDGAETVTAALELAWIEAAEAVVDARCPVAVYG